MPISGNTHSLPAGSLAADGQPSSAVSHNNNPLSDLSAGVTESLSRLASHVAEINPHEQYERKFATVAEMQAANLSSFANGTVFLVQGYAIAGIGRALWKKISTPAPVKSWHKLCGGGAYVELLFQNGGIDPAAFYDGAGDWRAALNNSYEFVNAKGGGDITCNGGVDGFPISGPVRMRANCRLVGRAFILPKAGFVNDISFPTFVTNVPQVYNTLLYFNNGTHADDPTNFGWANLYIGDGIHLFGGFVVNNAVIIEGLTNYTINAIAERFNDLAFWPKYYCWGGAIGGYVENCLNAFVKFGEGANGVNMNGFRGFGGANTPPNGIVVIGDNNSFQLSGGFLEKCGTAFYTALGNGAMTISGMNFEEIATCVNIDGAGVAGRAAGPVNITGCFMEGTSNCVVANNAVVNVTGCRLRETPLAFSSTGTEGYILSIGNVFESTVTSRASGNVSFTDATTHGFANGVISKTGTGSPEGVVTAPVGSTFHRTDGGTGTSYYVKESGSSNTGWGAK